MKSKFGQLPVALKLVVICFFLLGLGSFWRFVIDIRIEHVLDIGPLISGVIEWGLAIGLINRNNESRAWAAFFMFLGSLVALFALAIMIFEDPNQATGVQIKISMPRTEAITFFVAYLILSAGALFTLMRPATKAFFAPQTTQEGE